LSKKTHVQSDTDVLTLFIMNEELNMFTLAAPNSFRYSWSDIWVLWQRKWCTL